MRRGAGSRLIARVANTAPQRPPPRYIGAQGRRRNKRFLVLATLATDCALPAPIAALSVPSGPPHFLVYSVAILVTFSVARGLLVSSLWSKPRAPTILLAVLGPWIAVLAACFVASPAAPCVFVTFVVILWGVALVNLPEAFVDICPGACNACGYDLAGLPPEKPCPECGASRPPPSPLVGEGRHEVAG